MRFTEYLLILFGFIKSLDLDFFPIKILKNTIPSVPKDYIMRNSSDILLISLRRPFSRNHLSIWNQCYIDSSIYQTTCNLYASRIKQLSIFKVCFYFMSLLLGHCCLEFHYLVFQKFSKSNYYKHFILLIQRYLRNSFIRQKFSS